MAIDLRSREGELAAAQRGRTAGLALAAVGFAITGVVLVAGLVAGGLTDEVRAGDRIGAIVAWTFGLTVVGFATLKIGIATDAPHGGHGVPGRSDPRGSAGLPDLRRRGPAHDHGARAVRAGGELPRLRIRLRGQSRSRSRGSSVSSATAAGGCRRPWG